MWRSNKNKTSWCFSNDKRFSENRERDHCGGVGFYVAKHNYFYLCQKIKKTVTYNIALIMSIRQRLININ